MCETVSCSSNVEGAGFSSTSEGFASSSSVSIGRHMGQQSSDYATAVETQIEASKVHWSEPSSDMMEEEESSEQRAASNRRVFQRWSLSQVAW